ncbi:hypothetical protein NMY22_g2211 [Coprinellus aureogranulatus]|nr:hypothetical protein NMY22_g2211 [Coprinellus aureogranulatus]
MMKAFTTVSLLAAIGQVLGHGYVSQVTIAGKPYNGIPPAEGGQRGASAVASLPPQPSAASAPDALKVLSPHHPRSPTFRLMDRQEHASLACGNPARAIPFYRSFNARSTDHFYTTNRAEHTNAYTNLGYSDEGISGYILPSQEPHTVPLYRLYNGRVSDHFYTTNAAERDNARDRLGYADEGVAGYVYPDAGCGALPLYRLYNAGWNDHFYTMNFEERENAAVNLGFTREGTAGYIFPL